MSTEGSGVIEIEQFLSEWQGSGDQMEQAYRELYLYVAGLTGVGCRFVSRPGVTYSLRPFHAAQTDRDLFAIMDVIDDDPKDRWLSICFYGDMINDPEERGELVPGGLSGSDGYCFDMYEVDETLVAYLKERLQESYGVACKEG